MQIARRTAERDLHVDVAAQPVGDRGRVDIPGVRVGDDGDRRLAQRRSMLLQNPGSDTLPHSSSPSRRTVTEAGRAP